MPRNEPFLDAINPAIQGDKYSENLYKWLKKHWNYPVFVAFSRVCAISGNQLDCDPNLTQTQNIMLGFGDMEDGWVHGSRLSEIICQGTKAKSWAFGPKYQFVPLPDWIEAYKEKGKCFIDPEHRLYTEFWHEEGEQRSCKWCDRKENKVTKMVPRYTWEVA